MSDDLSQCTVHSSHAGRCAMNMRPSNVDPDVRIMSAWEAYRTHARSSACK